MFKHIFITRMKCLIRNKSVIFWTFIFPIVLATLFKIAFSNLSSNEVFKPIDIAVINDAEYEKNQGFKLVIDQVSKEGSDKIFNVTLTEKKDAEYLLQKSKIAGYIYLDPEFNLVVKSSGLNQTIIKTFLENYKDNESTIASILKVNPNAKITDLINDISDNKEYTREVTPIRGEPDTNVNYFYSLIALACLYGSFLGLIEINDIQGDLSKRAARINMAPVHKIKVYIYSLSAAFFIHFVNVLFLLGYLNFVLEVDFGNQIGYILLLSLVGCATGVSLGTMVSALVKKSEGMKVAILIAVSMVSSLLAGMYHVEMKYIIEKSFPLIRYINPASLITDGFYTLYYYNTHGRFFMNISILTVLTIVFCLVTYSIIRRQKYASL